MSNFAVSTDPSQDAGIKPAQHYRSHLSPLRFTIRSRLLPFVRSETRLLAAIQHSTRCSFLDYYFAWSASLGSHGFYVTLLPLPLWLGYTDLGRTLIFVLGIGIYFSGALKDFVCLPRPLSPPLARITLSGYTALEYGFPSSHSANAMAVTLVLLLQLYQLDESQISPTLRILANFIIFLYSFSLMFGRIYCGMHGFLDIIVGALIGTFTVFLRYLTHDLYDNLVYSASPLALLIVPIVLLMLNIYPVPVDNCPCFDDAVAFLGVLVGVDLSHWYGSNHNLNYLINFPTPSTIPFLYSSFGSFKIFLRLLINIIIIIIWKHYSKKILIHYILPPIYKIFDERFNVSLPRKGFHQLNKPIHNHNHDHDDNNNKLVDVKKIDVNVDYDNTPNVPKLILRKRAVSIGPESEADVYETMAYREYRKRSISSSSSSSSSPLVNNSSYKSNDNDNSNDKFQDFPQLDKLSLKFKTDLDEENYLKSKLKIQRNKYDVEVIARLIVYSGVAIFALNLNTWFLEYIGLGCLDDYKKIYNL